MMGRPYCTTLTRANSALRRTMSPHSPSLAFPFNVWKVWAVKSWHSFGVWKVQVSGCGLHKWLVELCGLGKVSPVDLHSWVLWAYTGEFWAYKNESSRLVQVISGLQSESCRSTQIVLWRKKCTKVHLSIWHFGVWQHCEFLSKLIFWSEFGYRAYSFVVEHIPLLWPGEPGLSNLPAIFTYFFFELSWKFWHLLILNCKKQQSHLLRLFSSAVQECPSDWSSIWSIAYEPCSKSVEAVYKSENTQETCQWVHVCRSDADIVYTSQCWSSSTDPLHPHIWY